MPTSRWLIFTAIRPEQSAIDAIARHASIETYLIGIRAAYLPTGQLAGSVTGIILAGFAGALDPSLKVGDIVLDQDISLPVSAAITFRPGKIHTSAGIVATANEKARLFRETGALAVDMEAAAVRDYAQRIGARFIHVRAISDAADETLDPAVLSFMDDRGRLRPGALALTLARRPGLLPHLLRLGANTRTASRQLRLAIEHLCAGLA